MKLQLEKMFLRFESSQWKPQDKYYVHPGLAISDFHVGRLYSSMM